MSALIHKSAVIDPTAVLADDVEVAPFAFIGPNCRLASGVRVGHGATIEQNTTIGRCTRIWPQAAVGVDAQDLKYAGEETFLEIGENCMIREFASLHRGTSGGGNLTKLGNYVLVMNGAHVGHDATIGDHCIVAAHAAIGGHVIMDEYAIIGGVTGVHQWVRIGAHAMIGFGTMVNQDVLPFAVVKGTEAKLESVNIVGLKRRGFSKSEIRDIRSAMKTLFLERGNESLTDAVEKVRVKFKESEYVTAMLDFVESEVGLARKRGFASV
ncbi:MAG: acyl-ACP--UDP-N-acetylglucosamine O-acyltransferase [Alphaproteobacteria bacterium]